MYQIARARDLARNPVQPDLELFHHGAHAPDLSERRCSLGEEFSDLLCEFLRNYMSLDREFGS